MSDIKRILVGIDLLQAVKGSESQFAPPVEQAIKQAIWLGAKASAEVTFFAAVENLEANAGVYAADVASAAKRLEERGQGLLQQLVERAQQAGAKASSKLVAGQGWLELTHEAVRGSYDLALVGTRGMGAVGRFLYGSTAMKLVHNCPAPIWVTHPNSHLSPTRILVASDFSSASDGALRLAIRLAELAGASVEVLHVFASPFARLWDAGLFEAQQEVTYHSQAVAEARTRLEQQIMHAAGGKVPPYIKPEVVEGVGHADAYILDQIQERQIDLLVMGTMARSGVPGVFIGNTAERLLLAANCSLVAVKPAGFKSPV